MSVRLDKLTSGLQVLRLGVEQVESATAIAMVKAGSRYETPATYGVAHFLEHMVFKGTKKYPNNRIISQTLDGVGAAYNAFTGEENTVYYVQSAATNLDLAIKMVGQMTTSALLEEEEINRERGVILEEIHMYADQPDMFNSTIFNQMFYRGCGIGHDILGTSKTVGAMKRENFCQFLDTWYGAENMLVVIAGKKKAVMAADTLKQVEEAFVFPKSRQKTPDQRELWVQNFTYGPRLHFEIRDTEQMHYLFGWPGINRFDNRDEILSLLSIIIGGNMSSRLFTQVRERRGLCYYVNSFTDVFSDVGCFGSSAGVNPSKLTEALKVSLAEFYSLPAGKNAITESELSRAKNYLAGHLALSQESTQAVAMSRGLRYLHEGKLTTVKQRLAKIKRVTLEQVRALAAQLLQEKQLRLSVIGNISKQQQKEIKQFLKVSEQEMFYLEKKEVQ